MNAVGHPLASTEYYLEHLCGYSDKAIQFAYGLVLNREQAVAVIYEVYERFSQDLPLPTEGEKNMQVVLKEIWRHISALEDFPDPSPSEHKLFSHVLKKLNLLERAVLILHDHFGLAKEDSSHLIEISHDDFLAYLARSRKHMMHEEF